MATAATASQTPSIPVPGDLVGGKYRVVGQIAAGGMGVVLEAKQEGLGRRVALKLLRKHSADRATRFEREARAAATLTSSHVVRIFDVGGLQEGEQPYIAMEYLEGADLSALLADGPLPEARALDLLLQACEAIAEAHAAGIVHRDLKPSNLFLAREGGAEVLKVLDFGISKQRNAGDEVLTATSNALGTPLYMSPEQVRDAREVDARSDIWSLGVVLHELLSGQRPFRCESLPGAGAAIVADQPTPLSEDAPEVSAALEGIVARCLQKDPAARYASVSDLAQALELAGLEVARDRVARVHRASGRPGSPTTGPSTGDDTATKSETSVRTHKHSDPGTLAASTAAAPALEAPERRGRSWLLVPALALGALGLGLFALSSNEPVEAAAGAPTIRASAANAGPGPASAGSEATDAPPLLSSNPSPPSSAAPLLSASSAASPRAKPSHAGVAPGKPKKPTAASERDLGPLDSRD